MNVVFNQLFNNRCHFEMCHGSKALPDTMAMTVRKCATRLLDWRQAVCNASRRQQGSPSVSPTSEWQLIKWRSDEDMRRESLEKGFSQILRTLLPGTQASSPCWLETSQRAGLTFTAVREVMTGETISLKVSLGKSILELDLASAINYLIAILLLSCQEKYSLFIFWTKTHHCCVQ